MGVDEQMLHLDGLGEAGGRHLGDPLDGPGEAAKGIDEQVHHDDRGEAAKGIDKQVHHDDRGEAAIVVISMTRSMVLQRPPW